jgi:dipeptidyl aminopeptidase/acylaminoacyl peptidase
MNTITTKFLIVLALYLGLVFSNIAFADVIRTEANNGQLIMEDVPAIPQSLKDDLNRYQNVRSAPFRGWSLKGEEIYISTRFGDVSQLHKVSTPGGARQQLTFFDEPIGSVSRQPGGELLAFTMDVGGSENAQIFILDPSSGKTTMISDGESRNGSVGWRDDGKALAYQSTRRNGAANDLWMTEILESGDAGASKIILESLDGSWWGTGDWTADGSKMLVQQYMSITDSRVYLLDLESGEYSLLKGKAEQPSVNFTVAFDANGEGHYYLTDAVAGFAQLAHHNFVSGETKIITADISWDVESAVISDDRKQMAFSVNQGGTSQLYLLETRTNNYQKVSGLPLGLIGSLNFSPSGDSLAMTLNTAKSPSDSYVLNLKSNKLRFGDLTRWTNSEVGGLNTDTFIEAELIEYDTFDSVNDTPRKIPAFVYKPKNITEPVPVIISIHGGPESQYRPRFSSTYQLWLSQLGAAVIAPNVRGSSGYGRDYVSLDNGFKREDSVKDIGALLDWIATQPDLDENRVLVIGGSYGGYMVLASAMYYSDRLLGGVNIVGVSNFVTFLQNTSDYRRDLRRPEYGDERDPEMYAHLQKISPNNNVEKIKIPLFVVQGNNDPRVPVTEAEQIVAALREQGNEVWYMNALNEGHGYRKKENSDIYRQAVVMFFKNALSNEQPNAPQD